MYSTPPPHSGGYSSVLLPILGVLRMRWGYNTTPNSTPQNGGYWGYYFSWLGVLSEISKKGEYPQEWGVLIRVLGVVLKNRIFYSDIPRVPLGFPPVLLLRNREIRSVFAKVNQKYRDLAIVGFPLLCFSRQQEGNPKNTTDSEKM